jgi:hypothetical protein
MTQQHTWNPGFPVHVYHEGMDLPKEGTYFVVAGNGLFMHKDTGIVRCFVPVNNISMLHDLNALQEVECKLPKIPARHVWRIKQFFKRVVEKHRAEAEVTLYYSKEHGDYKIHVPQQEVSHGGVRYERHAFTHIEGMENYLRVGTIHSHCDFGAFHSGTDVGDEEDFDGLHVTFGHNDREDITISASVAVNGHRTLIDPESVLEGIVLVENSVYYRLVDCESKSHEWANGLDEWMDQVRGLQMAPWNWAGFLGKSDHIRQGDKVVWKGDLSSSQIRTVMGNGPFEVIATDDDKIVISTHAGLASFSHKLFKKEGS